MAQVVARLPAGLEIRIASDSPASNPAGESAQTENELPQPHVVRALGLDTWKPLRLRSLM